MYCKKKGKFSLVYLAPEWFQRFTKNVLWIFHWFTANGVWIFQRFTPNGGRIFLRFTPNGVRIFQRFTANGVRIFENSPFLQSLLTRKSKISNLLQWCFPTNLQLLIVNNRHATKRRVVCLKLAIKTGRRHWRRSGIILFTLNTFTPFISVSFVDFE